MNDPEKHPLFPAFRKVFAAREDRLSEWGAYFEYFVNGYEWGKTEGREVPEFSQEEDPEPEDTPPAPRSMRDVFAPPAARPEICRWCGDSGYESHPDNGANKNSRRCRDGCAVKCAIRHDPNCDNPGGQH